MGRKRIGKVLWYNPWNKNTEVGDNVVCPFSGKAWKIYESNGWGKRALGELSMREIKKEGYKATIKDDELVWVKQDEEVGDNI